MLGVGLVLNILFPILYAYFFYMSNSGLITTPEDPYSTAEEYRRPYIMAKYSVGIL
jgi:hypothetical protein